ncbi:TIGR04283 family arsenosugar biosynthesis glycosyltransferase [Onishia taeanensis]
MTAWPFRPPPRLSIIIPTLDEAATLEPQLAALLGLWVCGVELIVVDGGSRDATVAIAKRYADRVLISEPGRARQMNLGARASRGEQLVFLHADTRLPRRADRRVARAVAEGACWGRFDVRLSGEQSLLGLVAFCMNWRSRLTGIATGDQALFMTRAAFDAVGGYPDQPLMEDIEISKRLKRLARPACLDARVVSSGRRWENDGLWVTVLRMWRLRYRYWRGEDSHRLAEEYRHAR